MLDDKPHLVYFIISIIAGVIMMIMKLQIIDKIFESPILYWVIILLEGIPMLFGAYLFLGIAYWFMAVFKKSTHPIFNILQLISPFLAYFGICFLVGSIRHDNTGMESFNSTSFTINIIFVITMSYITLAFLVLNIIYSLVRPH